MIDADIELRGALANTDNHLSLAAPLCAAERRVARGVALMQAMLTPAVHGVTAM
jgi:hypothetical protein